MTTADFPSPLPSVYLSHGGGPWIYMDGPMRQAHAALEVALRALPQRLGRTPRAVLMVSAHWETPQFTLQTAARPGMLYDYGGFPPHTYQVTYPAPGAPEWRCALRISYCERPAYQAQFFRHTWFGYFVVVCHCRRSDGCGLPGDGQHG